MRLIDRVFKLEEINGNHSCPTYLYRWTLARIGWLGVYLHHFVGDDWSRDMHDHPKRFVSIGLWGNYIEETPGKPDRRYRAPWIRSFPADHIHRIRLDGRRSCWTLVFVLKPVRAWGFWRAGRFVPWRQYVHSEDAIKYRSCP